MGKDQYHHGDLKNAIITAAVRMIRSDGIGTLTLRNVAQETGVSHSAMYRHYRSKEDLVVAIAISGFRELAERLAADSVKNIKDTATRLVEMGKTYIRYAVENPEYYRIMFGDYIKNKTGHPGLFEVYDTCFRMIIDVLGDHERGKRKPAGDKSINAIAIWSLLHGYSCLVIDNIKDENVGSDLQIQLVMERMKLLIK